MPHHVLVSCSSNRQLLLCGMHSGFIRVYPLQRGDHSLTSMHAYWTLSVHDNQYGHLKHIRSSYDDQFVLTAGDDGNIFSFALLPPEDRKRSRPRKMAVIPSPRVSLHAPPPLPHPPAGPGGAGSLVKHTQTRNRPPSTVPVIMQILGNTNSRLKRL